MATAPLVFPPYRVPLVDPENGLITREWGEFFRKQWQRTGDYEAPTNNELVVDMPDDAGLEEIRSDFFKTRDALSMAPPLAPLVRMDDPHARIEALEATVAQLQRQIQDLNLSPPEL